MEALMKQMGGMGGAGAPGGMPDMGGGDSDDEDGDDDDLPDLEESQIFHYITADNMSTMQNGTKDLTTDQSPFEAVAVNAD